MSEIYENGPFSLLPDRRPPWKQFMLTMGVQGIALFVLAWAAVLNLAVLDQPVRDYHFVRLVETPPPEIHEPAPVREIPPPRVLAHIETPAEVLRVPAPEVKPKTPPEEALVAPQVAIAASKPVPLPPTGAGHSEATGEDSRIFHRQLSRADDCRGPEERADRRLWRSQWCARA